MTLNEYQDLALRTAPQGTTPYHDLLHGGMGVATEAGELLDVLKKHHAYGRDLDPANLREEIGDILWYTALLARSLGTNLDSIAAVNVAKLRKRYPERYTHHNALNRDLTAERAVLENYDRTN
jgi:NTP pyrophosphatase (non-canonical NTP hydrolase)